MNHQLFNAFSAICIRTNTYCLQTFQAGHSHTNAVLSALANAYYKAAMNEYRKSLQ